ncbi:MAG TPA: DUF4421 domain-containing protein, partial [Chitinophagaceae bacterium]|nr:DUF4421 domain-containing protein [Chitinophagaceae bacterium]
MIRATRHPLRLLSASFVFFALLCGMPAWAQVQPSPDHDTSYYESFPKDIIGRVFVSKKATSVQLQNPDNASRFSYEPNTPATMGAGITYHALTLNLAVGFPAHAEKGKTHFLDLQTHFYGRKWTIDLLGQFYKGYYLNPRGLGAKDVNSYYIRPDLHVTVIGGAAYHLFNWDRFSYRAAIFQDERQKKSAGSFLLGGETYYGIIKADSSLVPPSLSGQYSQRGVRSLRFFKIGPGAGYAHTFVIESDFFITASLQANLSVDFVHQAGGGAGSSGNRVSLTPGYIYRIVAGYGKGVYNINLSAVGNSMNLKANTSDDKFYINTATYRLTFSRRFTPGPWLRNKLKPVDDL